MSNFQTRFDAAATEASRLVVNNGSEIRNILPGLYGRDFDRLSKSISRLLERVDKGNVDHPEYLAHSSGNIAEYAVSVMGGVPSSIESGASHFAQTTLPSLLLCEERLAEAVGNYFYQVREVKNQQVKEIQKLAEETIEFRQSAYESRTKADEIKKLAEKILDELQSTKNESTLAANRVEEIRSQLQKLASGDGRGKSLEALKRTAESKLAVIEEVLTKATAASQGAETSRADLQSVIDSAKASQEEILSLKKRATEVLSLSSQAGLASSYLQESRKLTFRSYIFTGILYFTSISAALIAAFYVLPSLEHSFVNNQSSLVARALPVTLLRSTVLAPLVYVIYFTTRQISALETLRMDYAEKAAASLAYSGYKGEMSDDQSLLERLRGSLLLKFAEHPERLLRKRATTDSIKVETPGFTASSVSSEPSDDE